MAKTTSTKPREAAKPAEASPSAIYEVTCHSVEIGHLICYRTHRLTLTQAQAEALNSAQPGTVKFIGI